MFQKTKLYTKFYEQNDTNLARLRRLDRAMGKFILFMMTVKTKTVSLFKHENMKSLFCIDFIYLKSKSFNSIAMRNRSSSSNLF